MTTEDVRDTIIALAPQHVIFDGWSMKTLRGAAVDAGLDSGAAARAFPGGPVQAVEHFFDYCDRGMLAEVERRDLGSKKIHERIEAAIRVRLDQAGDREVIRRALSLLALPLNLPVAVRIAYRTVDAMWHACGDTSTDINFYTKRALLAGVYSGTVVFWLGDSSEESNDTWEFLDRRLVDMMEVFKVRGIVEKRLAMLPSLSRLFGGRKRGRASGMSARADFMA